MSQPKRILIVGATSGIGREVARLYCRAGWRVGIAGRRADRLEALQQEAPEQIETEQIDVTQADAPLRLEKLIQKTGGMDVFLLSSGIGSQNRPLDPATEIATVQTNAEGFTRMVTAAYHYFCRQGYGQLAVISSIAGTKGLGAAPAYSATKRFQNLYIDALELHGYSPRLCPDRPFAGRTLSDANETGTGCPTHCKSHRKEKAPCDYRLALYVVGGRMEMYTGFHLETTSHSYLTFGFPQGNLYLCHPKIQIHNK